MPNNQLPEPKPTRHATPLVPIDDALTTLLRLLSPLDTESVPLSDALGRVLAADVLADADQPAFDRAMMDGFAVRAADCAEPGAVLTAVGAAAAGVPLERAIGPGECARVMTGGVVPPGADAVIAVEDVVSLTGDAIDVAGSTWRFHIAAFDGKHIARRGSEVEQGAVVVRAGTLLSPAHVGAMAHFGCATPLVFRQPKVAVLPTGTEVIPIDQTPAPGQVRNSNSYAIAALIRAFGGVPTALEVVQDSRAAHIEAMQEALREHDVLITSGGVSMGDYDLVAACLRAIGAEIHFHRVQLKPGKPLLCATVSGKLILGLPGNPVSGLVCALLFLRPAIAALSGAAVTDWRRVEVPLAHDVGPAGPRSRVLPGRLVPTEHGLAAEVIRTAGSADLAHFSRCEILLRREAGEPAKLAGEPVTALLWPQVT